MVGWQIDNELGSPKSYSPIDLAAYRAWLAEKYNDDITQLNDAWGTVFWSEMYQSLNPFLIKYVSRDTLTY